MFSKVPGGAARRWGRPSVTSDNRSLKLIFALTIAILLTSFGGCSQASVHFGNDFLQLDLSGKGK
jgi:hypothetical protein